jgi:hypothetical protein
LKGCLWRAAATINNVKPGDRFPPNCDVRCPMGNLGSRSIPDLPADLDLVRSPPNSGIQGCGLLRPQYVDTGRAWPEAKQVAEPTRA